MLTVDIPNLCRHYVDIIPQYFNVDILSTVDSHIECQHYVDRQRYIHNVIIMSTVLDSNNNVDRVNYVDRMLTLATYCRLSSFMLMILSQCLDIHPCVFRHT
jgi:hypothetical protein